MCASVAPALFLGRLAVLTLYSMPEADDYCLSYLNIAHGFVAATQTWYDGVVGRVVPLLLMQVPAAISHATDVDYLITYAAMLGLLEVYFVAATIAFARRLWPRATLPQVGFIGTALAAITLSDVPNLREFLYWLPGTTCYVVPGAIVMLVLVEFVRSIDDRTPITPFGVWMLAAGCFVAALCNEFTPVWLLGLILASAVYRAIFWRDGAQIRAHAVIGAATLVGFVILLLAPGNAHRMAQMPDAGNFGRSFTEAFRTVALDVGELATNWRTIIWSGITAVFTAVLPPSSRKAGRERLALAALIMLFCCGCIYVTYFTALYATGAALPPRTQNETVVLFVGCLTICTALLVRSRFDLAESTSIIWRGRSFGEALATIIIGACLIYPLWHGSTAALLRLERDSFHGFWLEGVARHAQLMQAKPGSNLVVAVHKYFPAVLAAYELKDTPGELPNDCVAQFYGVASVVVKPALPDARPSEVLAVLSNLIRDIRSHDMALKPGLLAPLNLNLANIAVPPLLVTLQNFASPWGRVTMTKLRDGTVTLDFFSVTPAICSELLAGGSRINGVRRVAGSSRAAAEMQAPVNAEMAERSCANEEGTARLIF